MENVYGCHTCSLRVRVSNRAAIALYKGVLGYDVHSVDENYYADGENAYDMKKTFNKKDEPKTDEKGEEEKKKSDLKDDADKAETLIEEKK